jgi:hypothetical protein
MLTHAGVCGAQRLMQMSQENKECADAQVATANTQLQAAQASLDSKCHEVGESTQQVFSALLIWPAAAVVTASEGSRRELPF